MLRGGYYREAEREAEAVSLNSTGRINYTLLQVNALHYIEHAIFEHVILISRITCTESLSHQVRTHSPSTK